VFLRRPFATVSARHWKADLQGTSRRVDVTVSNRPLSTFWFDQRRFCEFSSAIRTMSTLGQDEFIRTTLAQSFAQQPVERNLGIFAPLQSDVLVAVLDGERLVTSIRALLFPLSPEPIHLHAAQTTLAFGMAVNATISAAKGRRDAA